MDDKDNKLEITNAAYNDSGRYVCTATNILGQDKKEVKLLVEGTFRLFSLSSHCFRDMRDGLMLSVVDSRSSGPRTGRGRKHCVLFLDKTLYSHSASLQPGVSMGT